MGDSGGDGPHFAWGADRGAFLIACMPKPSLKRYCRQKNIQLGLQFGPPYEDGQARCLKDEMRVDFRDLIPVLSQLR